MGSLFKNLLLTTEVLIGNEFISLNYKIGSHYLAKRSFNPPKIYVLEINPIQKFLTGTYESFGTGICRLKITDSKTNKSFYIKNITKIQDFGVLFWKNSKFKVLLFIKNKFSNESEYWILSDDLPPKKL